MFYFTDVDHGFGWNRRYRIIKGICEGLKYLHMRSRPVYHLDLKPDNILLDDNMVPKIADFGLSRLLGEETTKATISAVGTWYALHMDMFSICHHTSLHISYAHYTCTDYNILQWILATGICKLPNNLEGV